MEMPNDALITRIEALFRLGEHTSTGRHEAAVAMEKAQALLLAHNLTRADIHTNDPVPTPTDGIGKVDINYTASTAWNAHLLNLLARTNLCRVIRSRSTNTCHLFGRRANVFAVVKMFDWLSNELTYQAMRDWRIYKADAGTQNSRAWRTDFYQGAISTLYDRLEPAVAVFSRGSGRDIVLANTKLVDDAVHRVFPKVTKGHSSRRHIGDGYASGRQAGATVRMGPQGGLNGGSQALNAGR